MARVAVEMGARRDVTITLTIKVGNATALAAVMKSIAAIAQGGAGQVGSRGAICR
jgi:hypothetical protein